jgi:hypothetical protein
VAAGAARPEPAAPATAPGLLPTLGLVVLALALGAVTLSLVFTDLGPEETSFERGAMLGLFCFFSGALVGYLSPRLWLVGVLTAWGGIILGFPVAVALLGAFIGSTLKSRRVVPRLLDRMFRSP